MGIVLARIDNRLLHGITATQWAPKLGVQRVMVIDDETAGNPMMKEGMKMARPAGMSISIIPYEKAAANLKAGKYGNEKIFVLTKHIQTLQKLIEETGILIKEINYGATAQRPDEAGLIRINKFAAMDQDEQKAVHKLLDLGVHIYAQYLIKDSVQELQLLLKK